MRIVFMGTPEFAVPVLDALVEAGHELVGVVARPDRPKGRGRRMVSPPTVARARELGLPIRQPRAIRRGPFPEWLEGLGADVAVVVAYGRILTPRLLAAPARGCINIHASLLPRYRGAGPIQWSLIRGERETGVCTMQMDVGMDTGDLLLTARTPIGADETAGELATRLSAMGASLIVETLACLDTLTPQPQDHDLATHAPMLEKRHGRIDWTLSAQSIHDLVRGVEPWPGGQARFRDAVLKIRRTRTASDVEAASPPGTIIQTGRRLLVATGDGALEMTQVQPPGKRAMSATAWANGARVSVGESLT